MTDLSELDLWSVPPAPDRPARPPKRHRHQWRGVEWSEGLICGYCGIPQDIATSRRGRNNRKRGGSAELDVARAMGGDKVGPLGLPWDVTIPGYMRLQVKKLARWPSLGAVLRWMDAIPIGPEMRAVAIVDAPGPGRKPRRLLVLDLDEFARWHGDPLTEGLSDDR